MNKAASTIIGAVEQEQAGNATPDNAELLKALAQKRLELQAKLALGKIQGNVADQLGDIDLKHLLDEDEVKPGVEPLSDDEALRALDETGEGELAPLQAWLAQKYKKVLGQMKGTSMASAA